MKSASQQLQDALANGSALRAEPVLLVDWNLNRYHETDVDNQPSDQDAGFDIEIFPVESLTSPQRPTKGINKARVGQARIAQDYADPTDHARFYIADVDDVYKYWTSPLPAVGGLIPTTTTMAGMLDDFGNEVYPDVVADGLTTARPYVAYGTWNADHTVFTGGDVEANKVVITLENSWASPNDFDIVITSIADGTVTIHSTDLSGWEASGQIVLRWNGFNWSTANQLQTDEFDMPITTPIQKIQLVVRSLKGGYERDGSITTYKDSAGTVHNTTGGDSYLDVIEIAAHLEADLSNYFMGTDTTFDIGDVSNLYPLGSVTTNEATLTLSNLYKVNDNEFAPGAFNERNTDMVWHDYLEPNAKVTLTYNFYDASVFPEVFLDSVQELEMYTGQWTGQVDESVSVELADYSKFFNTQMVPNAMWEGLTASEIVWRVLDSVGFNNYIINNDSDFIVPIFHMSTEQNVWEVLGELSQAAQMAIYFDAYGLLRVKSYVNAFSDTDSDVLLTAEESTQLANIITLNQTESFEPNSIKITYQATNWEQDVTNLPVLQQVWTPEGDEVLRSTQLVRSLGMTDTKFWISAGDAKIWPFEGLVNIDGELIRYSGKEFNYYTGANGGIQNTAVAKSQEDFDNIQKTKVSETYRYKTAFNGALVIAADEHGALERGVWNTEQVAHSVDTQPYSTRNITNGNHHTNAAGFRHLRTESKVSIASTPHVDNYADMIVSTIGGTSDTPFTYYGTKMRFVAQKGRNTQCAGIVIHNSGNTEDGYYIEITPTSRLGGKERKNRQELILYSRVGGKDKRQGSKALAIGENIDYEIDVTYRPVGNDHRIQIWVNGKKVLTKDISGAEKNAANGRFGMFIRGQSQAEYEFLYAIKQPGSDPPDDFSYMDKIKRGYTGSLWDREWVFDWRTKMVRKTIKRHGRRVKKRWRRVRYRFNQRFFDEFGPYVHEVREYEVKFDPSPVQFSQLYLTNDWSAAPLEYFGNPYGANFVIANTARENAVINGDDTLSYAGTGESISQVVTVLGKALVQADEASVVAENTDQINRRGKNESELSSPWIQTEAMANTLADWIRTHFTYGNEGLEVQIFGNPLIEVGDIAHVVYPDDHIDGDFYVVGVSSGFDNGYTTTVTLRERV